MPVGVSGFKKERLIQARNARGLTAASLSDLAGVSQSTVSLYEKGTHKPKQETLDKLERVLNVPPGFFLSAVPIRKPTRLFYRSMSAATKSSRLRAEARYEWALESVNYVLQFLDFPELNLPDFDIPDDFHKIDSMKLEFVADQLRQYWSIGAGPVANMIRTLESNGIVVWRTSFEAETLDAFSEYREPHPVVVLASDKENYFRSRFDAAHELGHLVLHRHIDPKNLRKSSEFRLLENQAHHFAGAFLLPAVPYSKDLSVTSIDAFRSLKPRWKTSIGVQIKRCRQLGLIDENQEKRLWINRSRRGWRIKEPLDDSTPTEKPNLISKSFRMLIEEGVRTKDQIAQDLSLVPTDIEKINDLPPGFISGGPTKAEPILKSSEAKVIPFRR